MYVIHTVLYSQMSHKADLCYRQTTVRTAMTEGGQRAKVSTMAIQRGAHLPSGSFAFAQRYAALVERGSAK